MSTTSIHDPKIDAVSQITYKEVTILISEEGNTFTASFLNEQGNREMAPIQGCSSIIDAETKAKNFLEENEWRYVKNISFFHISIRRWSYDQWGFGLNFSWRTLNSGGYPNRQAAIAGAEVHIKALRKIYAGKKTMFNETNHIKFREKSNWQEKGCPFCTNDATLETFRNAEDKESPVIRCCTNNTCKDKAKESAIECILFEERVPSYKPIPDLDL